MALGELLFPLRYTPLYQGATVPAGKLHFYRTGTTTDQDTYSDSTLLVANSNPVVLDSNGSLATKVYGDPGTGYDYRVRLYDSSDTLLWTEDDVVVPSRDVATVTTGSFTGTLTGFSSSTTGTVTYTIIADDEGTGLYCILNSSAAITNTSNATSMTMTGLPSACQPTGNRQCMCLLVDSGSNVDGSASLSSGSGTITFGTDDPFSGSGFTNTGTKGTATGWTIGYPL